MSGALFMRGIKQVPFRLVWVVIAVAAIGIVGVAGWFVYQRSNTKDINTVSSHTQVVNDVNSQQSTASAPSHATPTPSITYFTIKEWSVRAPYDGSLGLLYVLADSNSAALSSSQLAAGGPAVCADTLDGEAGHLARYLPTDANLRAGISQNETAEQFVEQNPTVPHAKVGNYIYIYWSYVTNGVYSGPCNDKSAAVQTTAAYSELVPKLEAIQ